MKKINIKWTAAVSMVMVAILFSCHPDDGSSITLGGPPKAKFTAFVNSNGYTVSMINNTRAIPYWKIPAMGISEWKSLDGDTVNMKFLFPGQYTISMLVVGHGGVDSTSLDVTTTEVNPDACNPSTALGFLASCTQKTWQVIDSTGGFAVGPGPGDGSWWTAGQSDMDTRSCATNDTFTFVFPSVANGLAYTFNYDNLGDFYDNGYLGNANNTCEPTANYTSAQAPFGPGTFTYSVTEGAGAFKLGQIKVIGLGAHFGMEGVDNTGDEDHHPPVSSITYDIVSMKQLPTGDELVISIEYGPSYSGWWTFRFKEKK